VKITKLRLALASTLTVAVTAISPQVSADVNIDDIVGDQATTSDIVSYGLGPRGQRYSPLDTINKDNIGLSLLVVKSSADRNHSR